MAKASLWLKLTATARARSEAACEIAFMAIPLSAADMLSGLQSRQSMALKVGEAIDAAVRIIPAA